ncbi:helix-turn-helix domain-containing protein [Candidatus Woesearchaeota archaeon]|nr:helix-turn-helix domain-containing protein [Candidatus Woesearchaeota archaeon]
MTLSSTDFIELVQESILNYQDRLYNLQVHGLRTGILIDGELGEKTNEIGITGIEMLVNLPVDEQWLGVHGVRTYDPTAIFRFGVEYIPSEQINSDDLPDKIILKPKGVIQFITSPFLTIDRLRESGQRQVSVAIDLDLEKVETLSLFHCPERLESVLLQDKDEEQSQPIREYIGLLFKSIYSEYYGTQVKEMGFTYFGSNGGIIFYNTGKELRIKDKQRQVFRHLLLNYGITVSHEELFEAVWKDQEYDVELVKRTVSRLRKLLGDDRDHKKQKYLRTEVNVGWRLGPRASETYTWEFNGILYDPLTGYVQYQNEFRTEEKIPETDRKILEKLLENNSEYILKEELINYAWSSGDATELQDVYGAFRTAVRRIRKIFGQESIVCKNRTGLYKTNWIKRS